MQNLNPVQIAALPFGKGCRHGIADRTTGKLIHSSDSEAWIKGELQRLSNVRFQYVTKI